MEGDREPYTSSKACFWLQIASERDTLSPKYTEGRGRTGGVTDLGYSYNLTLSLKSQFHSFSLTLKKWLVNSISWSCQEKRPSNLGQNFWCGSQIMGKPCPPRFCPSRLFRRALLTFLCFFNFPIRFLQSCISVQNSCPIIALSVNRLEWLGTIHSFESTSCLEMRISNFPAFHENCLPQKSVQTKSQNMWNQI